MRREIPYNRVMKDYNKALSEVVSEIIRDQKENVISIYLTGSYARGDAADTSDFDIFCIFKTLNEDVLESIGKKLRIISEGYGEMPINPQCMTLAEFKHTYFDNWSMPCIIALDSVLLYGEDLSDSKIDIKKVEMIYKKYMVEVLMSIRHYMSVDKPVEKLTHERIKIFVLKPLMFALRLERFCTIGKYPLSIQDLLSTFDDSYRVLVEYFIDKEKFENDIKENHHEVLRKIHKLISQMIER